jgi:hypothetical protein
MAAPRKPKTPLQRIPTRKLAAGIKKDLRKMLESGEIRKYLKPKKGKE